MEIGHVENLHSNDYIILYDGPIYIYLCEFWLNLMLMVVYINFWTWLNLYGEFIQGI